MLQFFDQMNVKKLDAFASVSGNLRETAASDKNPSVLAKALAQKGGNLPKIYIACGTEDSLLSQNRGFRDLLVANGFDVTYEESPGGHNWDFWDTYIKKAIDWLPLDPYSQGIHSGNINK